MPQTYIKLVTVLKDARRRYVSQPVAKRVIKTFLLDTIENPLKALKSQVKRKSDAIVENCTIYTNFIGFNIGQSANYWDALAQEKL